MPFTAQDVPAHLEVTGRLDLTPQDRQATYEMARALSGNPEQPVTQAQVEAALAQIAQNRLGHTGFAVMAADPF